MGLVCGLRYRWGRCNMNGRVVGGFRQGAAMTTPSSHKGCMCPKLFYFVKG